jgi:uncharacterized protein
MSHNEDRRSFIKKGLATAAGIGILSKTVALTQAQKLAASITRNTMPKRKLGKTGHDVSLFSLGGQATIQNPHKKEEAIEIINTAIDLGVNYIDSAASYGGYYGGEHWGASERNIGEAVKDRRNEVFLATKCTNWPYDEVMSQFEQSLKNLQTDYIDLYQLHNLTTHSALNGFLLPWGAASAFDELKSQGVIGFTGVTGHYNPDVLKRAIEEYDFDCILMALNAADVHYLPFQYDLLDTAVKRNLGIIVMKVAALGQIFANGGIITMEQALRYVWSLPVSTAIVGIHDIDELEENVAIANNFERYTEQQMYDIEQITAPHSALLNYFKVPT